MCSWITGSQTRMPIYWKHFAKALVFLVLPRVLFFKLYRIKINSLSLYMRLRKLLYKGVFHTYHKIMHTIRY